MFSVSLKEALRLGQFWGEPVIEVGSLWSGQLCCWVSFGFGSVLFFGSDLKLDQF